MDSWNVLGDGWTPEIRTACQKECAAYGDPPCFALEGTGLVGGPIYHLTPCNKCAAKAKDTPNG